MSVLVDTPVWSAMLRRRFQDSVEARTLHRLVSQGEAVIVGAIRQEVLSGIKHAEQFARVRDSLRPFPDIPLAAAHYERAAEMYNLCRAKGVQGSNTDFLLCAVCELDELRIFTTDRDFMHYPKHLPIRLFE